MNKKVLFWQSTPYHIFVGGDGLYLHQLKLYFISRGWKIETITSNIDRPYIYAQSRYELKEEVSKIRGTYQIGRHIFFRLGFMAVSIVQYFTRMLFRSFNLNQKSRFRNVELKWVKNQIRIADPDIIIKCFDKTHHIDLLNIDVTKSMHLVGFMNFDEYIVSANRLVENGIIDDKLIEDFSKVDCFNAFSLPIVGFSSKFDRDRFGKLIPNRKSVFVGIGFKSRFIEKTSQKNNVLFVGNKTAPNRIAVEFTIQEIWPKVLRQCPNARLRIVGRVCRYFKNIYEGVEFVGEVELLDLEYENAKVVVAPLLIGSAGVKTKIAEGLSYGRVVVTTSLGVDSSDADQLSGSAIIKDDPLQFADAINLLLINDKLRTEMEKNAKSVFEKNFSFESAYKDLSEWL